MQRSARTSSGAESTGVHTGPRPAASAQPQPRKFSEGVRTGRMHDLSELLRCKEWFIYLLVAEARLQLECLQLRMYTRLSWGQIEQHKAEGGAAIFILLPIAHRMRGIWLWLLYAANCLC